MYEQVSHSLLNDILLKLDPEIVKQPKMRYFYTRLGANFYAIHGLFHWLYGTHPDFKAHMQKLVETMARQYIARPDRLQDTDLAREKDHNWFLSQQWVGMALYSDGFADNLQGLKGKLHYLQELGINMVHVMPVLDCPPGRSDGGYAVRDFHKIDSRIGTLDDMDELAASMHKRDMLLTLDVVLNHTSDEHEWARRAAAGEQEFQDYYYVFDDREMPDMFEETMIEIFPQTSPGNFTWSDEMGKWVMTSFNNYQWDLNYSNPSVLIEMLDIILFWANHGADIVRLDAVAFLWKKIGSTCQNEREAHLILQLLKDCCQVAAPGVLFIAEAIVAPVEIAKYFGEDAVNAKECEIAYNATFMALLWDAIATKKTELLNRGIRSIPDKLERATWLNYIRCHDDIGLGFDDIDIVNSGYEPSAHRRFLVDYFTGNFDDSPARGEPFGHNEKTGDARISGTLASLVGLESALESGEEHAIDNSINAILLLHSMVLSFGGIPLLYYGDEIGTLNDYTYQEAEGKNLDSRWLHRSAIDWQKADRRNQSGSVEYRIFTALKKMIAIRKETPAFADFNNRELLDVDNPHLLAFSRFDPQHSSSRILVIGNFDTSPQHLNIHLLQHLGFFKHGNIRDISTGESPPIFNDQLAIPAYGFYWLSE
ncbi:alpha-amylase family glycosyl hydrolase [Magnetovibrio blakemorei]|uniref:Alpha-amylase n=1 Tax=Magnetovibrio blakemorei TaxID=28181 RepID=A0A1E5Q5F3_9PROT|nr:alpha-amylase family glycosyl hydrolase [Magnetovibrio blakemorei]OEJ65632.1 alpha-amylase [Magnetovibrio blakemorei]